MLAASKSLRWISLHFSHPLLFIRELLCCRKQVTLQATRTLATAPGRCIYDFYPLFDGYSPSHLSVLSLCKYSYLVEFYAMRVGCSVNLSLNTLKFSCNSVLVGRCDEEKLSTGMVAFLASWSRVG